MITNLTGVRGNLNAVLTYVSLMARDVEYFLEYIILAILYFSIGREIPKNKTKPKKSKKTNQTKQNKNRPKSASDNSVEQHFTSIQKALIYILELPVIPALGCLRQKYCHETSRANLAKSVTVTKTQNHRADSMIQLIKVLPT